VREGPAAIAVAQGPELRNDGERLGLSVEMLHDPAEYELVVTRWQPTILALALVMPGADGPELLHECARLKYMGHLVLMSGGFELYLEMAEKIAITYCLQVTAKLTKPFRPKQLSYCSRL